jgi:putative transposase
MSAKALTLADVAGVSIPHQVAHWTDIVREFDHIAVGNVNAAGLAKTRLARSVLDAGWSSFRSMLRYKATAHGAWYEEVNESFSTRVCSSCHAKTGPKGIAELGIRSWVCAKCGVAHDRDINSAKNILFRSGLSNAC